ncbi:MAG: 6-phosphogluconolactonase [Limibacillus sp.]
MAALRDFPDQETLLSTVAEEVAGRLSTAIEERGSASLVVSGGRTPEALFQRLSRAEIPWSKVTVTLADERWVPESDPDSNAALTASLFPGAANLQAAMDLDGETLCMPIRAPGAAQPRMTLTLPALLNSRNRLLLITGEGTRQALASASAEGSEEEMPVRAFLGREGDGFEVVWAP